MNVSLTKKADGDLKKIHAYIKEDNLNAANTVKTKILTAAEILESFPLIGRIGRKISTRELIVVKTPYVIIYKIQNEFDIVVLRGLHTSRQWP